MNENEQRLALVPIEAGVDLDSQLLVYENAAAKALKISIHEFRCLVDSSVIPCRLHSRRKRRLFFMEDLNVYAKSLETSMPGRPPGAQLTRQLTRRVGVWRP